MDTPVAVEVTRGQRVESRHRVAVAIAAPGGRLEQALGDVTTPIYPRSAVKPIQAVPLMETGAAAAFAVSDAEVALAAASHGGEPMHVERVGAWLARLGLDETALGCGSHAPTHRDSARALRAAGESPSALHNNCSGKHAGMLAVALHLGAPVAGYLAPEHAVQVGVRRVFEDLAGEAMETPGIDGCGLPNWPMSVAAIAKAMANLLERGAAGERILGAMRLHPELVAGTGRLDTALMRARTDIVVKGGAEGVHVAVLPAKRLAVAIKAEDGAGRAADVALLAVLEGLVGGIADEPTLREHAVAPIRSVAGVRVGEIRPAAGWPRF